MQNDHRGSQDPWTDSGLGFDLCSEEFSQSGHVWGDSRVIEFRTRYEDMEGKIKKSLQEGRWKLCWDYFRLVIMTYTPYGDKEAGIVDSKIGLTARLSSTLPVITMVEGTVYTLRVQWLPCTG